MVLKSFKGAPTLKGAPFLILGMINSMVIILISKSNYIYLQMIFWRFIEKDILQVNLFLCDIDFLVLIYLSLRIDLTLY